MIKKGQRLHPGDVLRNDWSGDGNPKKFSMYIKRGSVNGHRTIDCVAYDGGIVRWAETENRLVVVGHLHEYDALKKALSMLEKQ